MVLPADDHGHGINNTNKQVYVSPLVMTTDLKGTRHDRHMIQYNDNHMSDRTLHEGIWKEEGRKMHCYGAVKHAGS